MTRVDFHILQASEQRHLLDYTCRLTEKATNQGHRVLIFTDGPQVCSQLDEHLWAFRPESFVPHTCLASEAEHAPVYITHQRSAGPFDDVLICTHTGPPPEFFSQFKRTIEIVVQQPARLRQSRQNYAFYKARGYSITTHKINI